MGTFFGSYFDFCLELALESWAKASLTQSLWVHDPNHTHSLASFQWSGLSDQRALHLIECCLQVQKWCPYKGRGVVPEPICGVKWSSHCRPRLFSCMCMAPHAKTYPPPLILLYLLAQNLFSKRIAPTDNMRPKSDNAIWRHRWLKG